MTIIPKRAVDLAVSIAALVLLAPALVAISLAIRLTLGGPVLFRQRRPGFASRPFTIFKFRTMTETRDAEGQLLPDSQRLTAMGRWLRATSLDELPELFNVLKGEMSLVGPRPLLIEYLDRYSPAQSRRHEAKPGITGWAQINGRNALSWEEKFELDVWYVDHRSIWLDTKILWLTLVKVLKREGVSAEGHSTMPVFMGRRTND